MPDRPRAHLRPSRPKPIADGASPTGGQARHGDHSPRRTTPRSNTGITLRDRSPRSVPDPTRRMSRIGHGPPWRPVFMGSPWTLRRASPGRSPASGIHGHSGPCVLRGLAGYRSFLRRGQHRYPARPSPGSLTSTGTARRVCPVPKRLGTHAGGRDRTSTRFPRCPPSVDSPWTHRPKTPGTGPASGNHGHSGPAAAGPGRVPAPPARPDRLTRLRRTRRRRYPAPTTAHGRQLTSMNRAKCTPSPDSGLRDLDRG